MRDERRWRDVPEINKALDALRKDLDREPVIQEDPERRDKLLLRRKGLRWSVLRWHEQHAGQDRAAGSRSSIGNNPRGEPFDTVPRRFM